MSRLENVLLELTEDLEEQVQVHEQAGELLQLTVDLEEQVQVYEQAGECPPRAYRGSRRTGTGV